MAHRLVLVGVPASDWRLLDASRVEQAREELSAASWLAIDCEFHAERRFSPRLYLVQARGERGHTWLLDPLEPELASRLAPVLRDIPWIVHAGSRDLPLLHDLLGAVPERVFDTQIAAGLVSPRYPIRLSDALEHWLDHESGPREALTDWSRRPLHREQLAYAASDVAHLHALRQALHARAEYLERIPCVEQACAHARAQALDPPPVELSWRRIPGAEVLSAEQAGVLKELLVWRREEAIARDQPEHSVASNRILIHLCRELPITTRRMSRNRRIPKGFVRRYGDQAVERIQRALQRPEWSRPTPAPPGSRLDLRARWLQLFAAQEGHQGQFAERLVMPRELAIDLAIEESPDRQRQEALLGWRHQVWTGRLAEALAGAAPLALP